MKNDASREAAVTGSHISHHVHGTKLKKEEGFYD